MLSLCCEILYFENCQAIEYNLCKKFSLYLQLNTNTITKSFIIFYTKSGHYWGFPNIHYDAISGNSKTRMTLD